jgi:hypothetical protein
MQDEYESINFWNEIVVINGVPYEMAEVTIKLPKQ